MYYLAFDCETTGLTSNCNILTAYFIILDEDFQKIDELDLKIKHNFYTVYTKALDINNIDLIKHDKEAIPLFDANELLINFLHQFQKENNKYTIIGHNVFQSIKMILSNKLISISDFNKYFINGQYLDTYLLCQQLKKEKKINKCQSLSLMKLCNYFDINNQNNNQKFHNAKYDTLCTIQLYNKIKELY